MEKIDKTLKRLESMVKFLSEDLRFNEVHLKNYKNEKGKIRYKGCFRVYNKQITFEDLTLTDLDYLIEGILIGYVFCTVKNEYKK